MQFMRIPRWRSATLALVALGLILTTSAQAVAQWAMYRPVYGQAYGPRQPHAPAYGPYGPAVQAYHPVAHHGAPQCCIPCPCPAPAAGTPGTTDSEVPTPDIDGDQPVDMPEFADVGDDFASAPQSAVPGVIGDSLGFGGCAVLEGFPVGVHFGAVSVCPAGGRKYKVAENTSPLPRCRVFYNFNYFDNALGVDDGQAFRPIDVRRHEFGIEYAFWCDMASVELRLPFSSTLNSDLNVAAGLPDGLTDTEFGNISVALKGLLYQDCCRALSAGVAADLPTADDINLGGAGGSFFQLENEVITVSPFVGWQLTPHQRWFAQGFVQWAIPVNDNGALVSDGNVITYDGELSDLALLHVDASIGLWVFQNCCGNGVALIGELHYTASLEDEEIVQVAPGVDYVQDNIEFLNATAGVTAVLNCWDVTTAVVVPLREEPNRFFDWELAVNVNRRF